MVFSLFITLGVDAVYNAIAETRKAALQALAIQLLVTGVLALMFLLQGLQEAIAALLGGASVAGGGAVFAWRALSLQTPSAGSALAGLLVGLVLKWGLVFGVLYLALARFGVSPVPLLLGMAGSTLSLLFTSKN